jgi:HKD family nuclease
MSSKQVIVGCPDGFDLVRCLHSAASVKLAMAFAKRSGWALLREALLSCDNKVKIVVGLNFKITDPELLDEWLELCIERQEHLEVWVAPELPVFHPKVMIIRAKDDSCVAIVGSGNLTGGGQLHNVECAVFLDDEVQLRQLETWYDDLESVRLSKKIIETYRPLYERAGKFKDTAVSFSGELVAALGGQHLRWYENLFLDELTEFFSTASGKDKLSERVDGANRIRKALQMPRFNFTKAGWMEFYRNSQFGSIRQGHPEMAEQVGALRRAFRFLTSKPLEKDQLEAV